MGMVVAVYWKTGGYPFVAFDDPLYVPGNPTVAKGLTLEGIRWSFSTFHAANWHPVTWLSHMADVSLFGMDAGRHHLVNLLLHALDSWLLFHVLRRLTGNTWESGLAAALFAVHPLHVESVAWISERKDLLSAFFFLLAIGAYARYCERPGIRRYLPLFLLAALGLLAKPMLVTLPFVLLLLDYWPLGRLLRPAASGGVHASGLPRKIILEKIPLMILSAASCVITARAQKGGGAIVPMEAYPLWLRAGNALVAYAGYLREFVWPSGLAAFYPHPGVRLDLWRAGLAGALLLAVTAWVLARGRSRGWLPAGWFWFLGTLVPVAGLVQVGGQAMADRYMYIPLVGLSIIAAWGIGELAWNRNGARPFLAAAAVAWLAALAVCAGIQVRHWRDSTALFTRALDVTSDNWAALNGLGTLAAEAGRDNEAIAFFREATRIMPAVPELRDNLGSALSKAGKFEEAVFHLGWAIRLQPDFAEAHTDLGIALWETGKFGEAVAQYREAIRYRPDYAEAHYYLGRALSSMGNDDEAAASLREAIRLGPEVAAEANNSLGALMARRGAYPEAVSYFREALRLKPDYPGARNNLAMAVSEQEKRSPKAR